MGTSFKVERGRDTVPLVLVINKATGVTGLSPTVAIRYGVNSSFYFDFDDNTFKTSGWTTRRATLSEIEPGLYELAGGLDTSAFANLDSSVKYLVAEYEADGAVDTDIIELVELEESITEILRIAKNRLVVNISTQKLELYNDAGDTVIQSWDLATEGGEPVATSFGVQTKRGVPNL
jgi:hypothetical protein